MESVQNCPVCNQIAAKKCNACGNVYYCSKDHQKSHWRQHAEVCKAFKLADCPQLGRHYVASRNIKVGEIILKDDQPIVAGPMQNSIPVCLNCYVPLQIDSAVPCEICGWPLCQNCTSHGAECDFTISRKGSKVSITDFGLPHPGYQCINVIRSLSLKYTKPETYKKLLNFEAHSEFVQKENELSSDNPFNVIQFVKRFFKIEDISEEEIAKVVGILQVNGHEVPVTETPHVAVYDQASFLEHSCRANCSKSFTNDGGMIIHAAIPIAKGHHITICYVDPLWGTTNRRHYLSRTKFFDCTCDRCSDSSEFGTMFNAIKCRKIPCTGFMLPESFVLKNPTDYTCKVCNSKVSVMEVEEILENIGIGLSKMKKNDVGACIKFLDKYKNVLHFNHFYNVDVRVALAQLIGRNDQGLPLVSEELLLEKIRLCKKLGELLTILAPAENRIRGLLLFDMHAALTEFSRRHREEDPTKLLMKSRKCLLDACRLLQREPELLPEGKIALQAKKNLKELSAIIEKLSMNNSINASS